MCMCVCLCVYESMCVHMFVCARVYKITSGMYMLRGLRICVCMCVCVCVRVCMESPPVCACWALYP
jgi:hypothetical protein